FLFLAYFPENRLKPNTSLSVPAGAGDAEAVGAEELSGSKQRQLKLAMATVAMEQRTLAWWYL
ncbi:MAG: hypothetical protein ACO1OQ_08300, partial [Rufibacter sp.]